jgi:hypothetical protein
MSDQAMGDAQVVFGDDVQVVPQQQVISTMDAPRKRVLCGDNATLACIVLYQGKHLVESRTRHKLYILAKEGCCGLLAIRSAFTLESHL